MNVFSVVSVVDCVLLVLCVFSITNDAICK